MDLEYMKRCFPYYTDYMWRGEEPAYVCDAVRVGGGYYDRWSTEWGVGHTYKDREVSWVSVIVPDSDGVHIDIQNGGHLNVYKAGITVCRQWTNDPSVRLSNWTRCPVKEYTGEEIRRFLRKFPDTLFYRLIVSEVESILIKENM